MDTPVSYRLDGVGLVKLLGVQSLSGPATL